MPHMQKEESFASANSVSVVENVVSHSSTHSFCLQYFVSRRSHLVKTKYEMLDTKYGST